MRFAPLPCTVYLVVFLGGIPLMLDKLPKLKVNGKKLPHLLTRFDIGYKLNGEVVKPYR